MGTPSIKSRIERIVSLLKTKLKTQAGTWIECAEAAIGERATAKRLRHDRVAYLR